MLRGRACRIWYRALTAGVCECHSPRLQLTIIYYLKTIKDTHSANSCRCTISSQSCWLSSRSTSHFRLRLVSKCGSAFRCLNSFRHLPRSNLTRRPLPNIPQRNRRVHQKRNDSLRLFNTNSFCWVYRFHGSASFGHLHHLLLPKYLTTSNWIIPNPNLPRPSLSGQKRTLMQVLVSTLLLKSYSGACLASRPRTSSM